MLSYSGGRLNRVGQKRNYAQRAAGRPYLSVLIVDKAGGGE